MSEGHCCSIKDYHLCQDMQLLLQKRQGMSKGANKPATHARVKLQPKTDMARNCVGTAYTAFSRCEKESNCCLVEPITQKKLFYINAHPRMEPRRNEEQRLQNLTRNTIEKYVDYSDIDTYVNILRELDLFWADGVHDSICSSIENNCCCVLCLRQYEERNNEAE